MTPSPTQETPPRAIARMVVACSGGGDDDDDDPVVVEVIVFVDERSGAGSPLSWLCECAIA